MTVPPPRFGGRATVTGVRYEERIAALLGTKMLAGEGLLLWEGLPVADIATITMQAVVPVDDRGLNQRSFVHHYNLSLASQPLPIDAQTLKILRLLPHMLGILTKEKNFQDLLAV